MPHTAPATLSARKAVPTSSPSRPRTARVLTAPEQRVRDWVRTNKGVLSRVAKEFKISVTFVQRIAYGREATSKGFRVETRLKQLGCPLIQKLG